MTMSFNDENLVNELARWSLAGVLLAVMLAGCGRDRIELRAVAEMPGLHLEKLVVDGNFLYGATPDDALIILDISNPEQPEVVGRLAREIAFKKTYAIAVHGDRVFLGRYAGGLVTVDISTPTQPVAIGGLDVSDTVVGIVIRERFAYIVGPAPGLRIYDISVPETPVLVGELDALGPTYDVALAGDFAFIAGDYAGICIADISDPTAPRHVSANGDPVGAVQVRIRDERAFLRVEYLDWGLATMDIRDPQQTRLTDFHLMKNARDFDLVDGVVYMLTDRTLTLLDTGSDVPEVLGEFEFPQDSMDAYSFAVSGDHVFVGEGPALVNGSGERLLVLKRQP
jgi:hypothetical protein